MNKLNDSLRVHRYPRCAFTLVELLTVIAIIGLLSGMLVPSIASAMNQVKKAKVKTQLSELVNAINQYSTTYHYFPLSYNLGDRDIDIIVRGDHINDFENFLSLPLSAYDSKLNKNTKYNPKGTRFYTFDNGAFNSQGDYVDAFGNTEFHILIDGDGDHAIDISAIERNDIANAVESNNDRIMGRVHMYVYPKDPGMIKDQFVSTWE